MLSTIYGPCFAGTSAASPAAAGFAALLLGANLATPGEPLAALVRHLTADIVVPGPDNASGAGKLVLPAVPAAPAPSTPAQFHGADADAHPRHPPRHSPSVRAT